MKISNPWKRIWTTLIITVLGLGLIPAHTNDAVPPTSIANIQPRLLKMATDQPETTVRVIAQKTTADNDLESLVQEFGGKVIKDLHIINAIAAEVPAGAIRSLANTNRIRWISLDGPVVRHSSTVDAESQPSFGLFLPVVETSNTVGQADSSTQAAAKPGGGGETCSNCLQNYYVGTVGADTAWSLGLDGTGIGVAVIDSGISTDNDFSNLVKRMSFSAQSSTVNDVYGHGTHVAGIIGGSGFDSSGLFTGIAPNVDLISIKISDDTGMAYESDTVEALQWILDNKDVYNIRVANLSINSTVEQSYHTSPLNAAVEILWFNNIVVVASAGNWPLGSNFNPINAAPANDPFIITVGASDEWGTAKTRDDFVALYSAYGTTTDGFTKPDIIAPGSNIVSVLAKDSDWEALYPQRVVSNGEYFKISGTSMAAPIVTGAVALLLQSEPNLTPDQVKYRLLNKSMSIGNGRTKTYPYLDIGSAINQPTSESANTNIEVSQLLWTGDDPATWGSVNWNSVNWNSVNWNSVNWNSVNWNSVNWNSVHWDQ